jgi:hypothetical protein
MGIRSACAVFLALAGPVTLVAADRPLTLADLSPGDQVRLRLSVGGESVRGRVEAAGADEIVVRPKDATQPPLHLSPHQMTKVSVARGRRSHWVSGAVIGFVPGALFTAAAVVGLRECDPECDHTGAALGYGLVGGAITGTVGALIGLAVKTDRWVPVEARRPQMALTLAPMKGGFRGHLSLRF